MEKPKCKMCGERHWSREPCKAIVVDGRIDGALRAAHLASTVKVGDCPPINLPAPARVANPTAHVAQPKFDRNEAHRVYMREYMRKRRAKGKAERGLS